MTVKVTVKVKLILRLIVPWDLLAEKTIKVDLDGSCNMVTSIWSVDGSILSSIQGRTEPFGVNILQL